MRQVGRLMALALLLSGAALAAGLVAHVRLERPTLPHFVGGYQAANAEQSIREEIPRGETVERWSRMITTQWLAGLTARITAVDFTRLMARNISGAGPGTRVTTPHELTISGRSAAQIQANCPRLAATGKPETVIMLVVAGEQDIMVRQVAVRSVPTADDLEWSEAVLGGTVLCKPGAAAPPCDRID